MDSSLEIFDCEQGSETWINARLGLPTASQFKCLLANGKGGEESKMRRKYLYRLAGERLTGIPAEDYRNEWMQRGNRVEPEARAWYARTRFDDMTQIGFAKRGKCGCSPDGLVGDEGVVEFKSEAPDLLIQRREAFAAGGRFPGEHLAQSHGNLHVLQRRAWIDLVIYCPKAEGYHGIPPLVFRLERDAAYDAALRDAVDMFDLELRRLVEKVKGSS